MDGLTFLQQIMAFDPIPVVMCSSLTEKGADITMKSCSKGLLKHLKLQTDGCLFISPPGIFRAGSHPACCLPFCICEGRGSVGGWPFAGSSSALVLPGGLLLFEGRASFAAEIREEVG